MNHARWRALLDGAQRLSPAFRLRQARVLARLSRGVAPEQVVAAAAVARTDVRAAGRLLAGGPSPRNPASARATRIEGAELPAEVGDLIEGGDDPDVVFLSLPPLQSCSVPIHPDRRAVVLPGPDGDLVAMTWPARSLPVRSANRARLDGLAQCLPPAVLPVTAPSPRTIVHVDGGDPWVLATHHGTTVEDLLRDDGLEPARRHEVVRTLAELRCAFLDDGWVWQGFAPRNMFLAGSGGLILIDFEECVEIDADPVRVAECLRWHELFFADSLTGPEAAKVFADHPKIPDIDDEHLLTADAFEAAVLGRDTITWGERLHLLARSRRIESGHERPDGGRLPGHGLGHFWGDFLPDAVEARIFVTLDVVSDPGELAAVLEVFEAAMEADIDAMLLADARGEAPPLPPRTMALGHAVDGSSAGHLLTFRMSTDDWAARVRDDPARVADRAVAALSLDRTRSMAVDALVGDGRARNRQRARLVAALDEGLRFLHGDGRENQFLQHAEPEDLLEALAEPLPQHGTGFDDVLAEVRDRIAATSVAQSHPGYLAFPDSGNAVAALAGAALATALNQNLIAVDRSAPSATFVTVQVVEWLRELVGYETQPLTALAGVRDVAGLPTSGGHMSNHIAMLTALGARFPGARDHGLASLGTRPVVVMAGPIAHYSHSDAAFHLGLGWDSVIAVPALPGYTTDPAAVERVLTDPPAGTTPFMVIGVAGNCRTTGLDDLTALAEVCARHEVWLHADACHGGSLIFDAAQRDRCLAGIERADSVSLDPHKGLFTPYPSSYVVFRDRGRLVQFSRHPAAALADGCWDLGLITPFVGSSAFQALPTWMLLKHVGTRRLGEIVAARGELVRLLSRLLQDSGLFVQLNDVDFYRLAFVFCPPAARALVRVMPSDQRAGAVSTISAFTSTLGESLYRAGRACFDEHTLRDLDDRVGLGDDCTFTVMAACPGNPLTTVEHIERSVEELVSTAHTLTGPLLDALAGGMPRRPVSLAGPAGWSDV